MKRVLTPHTSERIFGTSALTELVLHTNQRMINRRLKWHLETKNLLFS